MVIAASYPAWLLWGAADRGAQQVAWSYASWQFQRPANTEWYYHFATTLPRMGPLVGFALVGLVFALRRREPVLRSLAGVVMAVLVFASAWPTKGYGHLLVLVVPLALLASAGVLQVAANVRRAMPVGGAAKLAGAGTLVTMLGLGITSVVSAPAEATTGVPAVREAALWLAQAPPGCVVVGDVGVSNIVAFYSHSRPSALGVGSDVGRRNPAYRSDSGPTCVRYVVWDVWTERESPETAASLVRLARQTHARVAHVETVPAQRGGLTPAVIVFEVPA